VRDHRLAVQAEGQQRGSASRASAASTTPAATAPGPPAASGIDQVMGFPTTWALGYSPARLGSAQPRPGSTFGMVGSNGTAAYADIDSGAAVAVMSNRIDGDFSVGMYLRL
jgi:CubicO group peptidase (beta-lactamase class C family)